MTSRHQHRHQHRHRYQAAVLNRLDFLHEDYIETRGQLMAAREDKVPPPSSLPPASLTPPPWNLSVSLTNISPLVCPGLYYTSVLPILMILIN